MKNDIKVSNNFWLWEFFDQETYEDNSEFVLKGLLDPRIIKIAQDIREMLGRPITINDWKKGGGFSESGFRSPNTGVWKSKLSQHRMGRAIDIKVKGMESLEVQVFVRTNDANPIARGRIYFRGIRVMERDTKGWTHLDCRYTGKDYLVEVAG